MKKFLASFVLLTLIASGSIRVLAQSGGELRFCLRSEPKTLNPLLAADDSSETISLFITITTRRITSYPTAT